MKKSDEFKWRILSLLRRETLERVAARRAAYFAGPARRAKLLRIPRRWIPVLSAAAGILLVVATVLTLLPLFGGGGKIAPEYLGMSVLREEELKEGVAFTEDRLSFAAGKGSFGDIGEGIEDSFVTVKPPEDTYYVRPGEDFFVVIRLHNPDACEIQSFTLNGVKYAAYMFEEGSDLETLILRCNTEETEGSLSYTLDAIKYIDGEQIRDVPLHGNKTVSVQIMPEAQPTGSVTHTLGPTSLSLQASFGDSEGLIEKSRGEVWMLLWDGERVVEKKAVSQSGAAVTFEGLTPGKEYEYALVAVYDGLDGGGKYAHVLDSERITLPGGIEINLLAVESRGVHFSLWRDPLFSAELTALYLESVEGRRELSLDATSVSELTPHTEYTLTAEYLYLGVRGIATLTFTTAPLADAYYEVTFGAVVTTHHTVSFTVTEVDPEGIGEITGAELLYGGTVVQTGEGKTRFTFKELLSDAAYSVRVRYAFLSGGERVEGYVLAEARTKSRTAPTVNLVAQALSKVSAAYRITATDPDGILRLLSVELLKDGAVTDRKTESEGTFTALLSDTDYTVLVTYAYDLGDGQGEQRKTVTAAVHTAAKSLPTLAVEIGERTQNEISYRIVFTDPDGILRVTDVELCLGGEAVASGGSILQGTFSGLTPDIHYNLWVRYAYDPGDGRGEVQKSHLTTVKTTSSVPPTATVTFPAVTAAALSYEVKATDPDGVFRLLSVRLLQDGAVQQEKTSSVGTFSGLAAGSVYTVLVTYGYDLGDGQGQTQKTVSATAKTLRKQAPSFTCSTSGHTKTSFSYSFTATDPDGALLETSVELRLGDTLIHRRDGALTGRFEGLISNTSYTVTLRYTYDLGGDGGKTGEIFSFTTETCKYDRPVVTLTVTSVTSISAACEMNVSDPDGVCRIDGILLEGKDGTSLEYPSGDPLVFTGLTPGTAYSLIVEFSYVLKDGAFFRQTDLARVRFTTAAE